MNWLTLQQKRQLEKLAPDVDRELDNDRRFFARHPDRTIYVRLPYPAERKSALIAGTAGRSAKDSLYVLVLQVAPGARTRSFFRSPVGCDTDLSESQAREIFQRLSAARPEMVYLADMLHDVIRRRTA